MNKLNLISIIIFIVTLLFSASLIFAQTNDKEFNGDIIILGLEMEGVLSLINGLIALILFLVTFISYRRDGRKRLFYVSLAFLLFSLKGFLVSIELFSIDFEWVDPAAIILETIVILFFFYGVVRK